MNYKFFINGSILLLSVTCLSLVQSIPVDQSNETSSSKLPIMIDDDDDVGGTYSKTNESDTSLSIDETTTMEKFHHPEILILEIVSQQQKSDDDHPHAQCIRKCSWIYRKLLNDWWINHAITSLLEKYQYDNIVNKQNDNVQHKSNETNDDNNNNDPTMIVFEMIHQLPYHYRMDLLFRQQERRCFSVCDQHFLFHHNHHQHHHHHGIGKRNQLAAGISADGVQQQQPSQRLISDYCRQFTRKIFQHIPMILMAISAMLIMFMFFWSLIECMFQVEDPAIDHTFIINDGKNGQKSKLLLDQKQYQQQHQFQQQLYKPVQIMAVPTVDGDRNE
ncbi:hypothetical protein HUG17_3950 [Dermatophagoides farinae]|uniref:Uncharacterized protein n=1 Tax=Dermatophagoides farinae TaxID=6954 RepID=A0A9D4NXF7_DERFA|nr:uncharacterized protein LOC124500498 [Dermatophagoides farinae]XP_046920536.1 uncharacterized protein LOC124500498 [Dermatophagoides farinae]KAH7639917.1 hypothetical protein HUG17_3950 [Dermatophagoides farinae]